MKKLTSVLLIVFFLSNICFADNCDWSTVKKLPNGQFSYSPQLNLCVGKLVQDNKIKDQQIQDLTKAIQLKDLALKDADSRSNMWLLTAGNEQERLTKIDSDQKVNNAIYFGLGVLLTGLAVFGAAKAIGH